MARQLIYIWGAGASAEAIPVVSGFKVAVSRLNRILLHKKDVLQDNYDGRYDELIDFCWKMEKEADSHSSIDTYCKKLMFLRRDEDLLKVKAFLVAYYFFVEFHSAMTKDYIQPSDFKGLLPNNLRRKDLRYDEFLASILRQSTSDLPKFPSNVFIYSWNYDLQFERSLVEFSRAQNILEIINIRKLHPNDFYKNNHGLNYYKLNGLASHYSLLNNQYCHLDDESFLDDDELIERCLTTFNQLKNPESFIRSGITFAWENVYYERELNRINENLRKRSDGNYDQPSTPGRSRIKERINRQASTDVVLIGYSLPFYNREIDIGILKDLKVTNVYIQDQPENASDIRSRFIATHGRSVTDHNNIRIQPSGRFFIPPQAEFVYD